VLPCFGLITSRRLQCAVFLGLAGLTVWRDALADGRDKRTATVPCRPTVLVARAGSRVYIYKRRVNA
jgi:hypothetical protein